MWNRTMRLYIISALCAVIAQPTELNSQALVWRWRVLRDIQWLAGGLIQGGSDGLVGQHKAGQFIIQQYHSFFFSLLLF